MLKATQQDMNVRKRDGRVLSFDVNLITTGHSKGFLCGEAFRTNQSVGPRVIGPD